jgi:hypothetical protein
MRTPLLSFIDFYYLLLFYQQHAAFATQKLLNHDRCFPSFRELIEGLGKGHVHGRLAFYQAAVVTFPATGRAVFLPSGRRDVSAPQIGPKV